MASYEFPLCCDVYLAQSIILQRHGPVPRESVGNLLQISWKRLRRGSCRGNRLLIGRESIANQLEKAAAWIVPRESIADRLGIYCKSVVKNREPALSSSSRYAPSTSSRYAPEPALQHNYYLISLLFSITSGNSFIFSASINT